MKGIGKKLQVFIGSWIVLLTIALIPAFAQDDIIRIDSELVAFEIVAATSDGKPALGLTKKDFKVYENGSLREIDFFESTIGNGAKRPTITIFLIDVSGSVTESEFRLIRESALKLARRFSGPNSYFGVIAYGTKVKPLLRMSNSSEKLTKAFEQLKRDDLGYSTHTYDAVDLALRLIKKESPKHLDPNLTKRSILLITDGFPVGDIVSAETVIERAQDNNTGVYSVLLPSFSRMAKDKKPLPTPLELSGMIQKTGGLAYYAQEQNFELLFRSIGDELEASYVVAFYPQTGRLKDGDRVDVEIKGPPGVTIRQNRKEYVFRRPRQ
jgi:VWFA-related protein